ncbi:MAG: hypothetical protein HY897_00845 [Deltaproteobacteria bacterium]|nr:hypothetical protein [Deltaproteobacteria bacterium]
MEFGIRNSQSGGTVPVNGRKALPKVALLAFLCAFLAARCTCDDAVERGASGDDGGAGLAADVGSGGDGSVSCLERCTNLPHGAGGCSADRCIIAVCDPGWADCNGEVTDGCETRIDRDNANCGGCAKACAPSHGAGLCVNSACSVASCDNGWWDINGDPGDGCEYPCVATGGNEVPDGQDNDCNGLVDDTCRFTFLGEPGRIEIYTADATYPQMFWNEGRYYAVWRDTRDGNGNIYFTTLNADGTLAGEETRISHGTGDAVTPTIVRGGDALAVAWSDTRNGRPEIWFTRIDDDGGTLTSEAPIGTQGGARSPSLQWDWTNLRYVVHWYDDHSGDDEVYMKFIDSDGVPGGETTLVSGYQGASRGASMNVLEEGLFVAWIEQYAEEFEVIFVKVSDDGVRSPTDLLVFRGFGTAGGVGMAWGGEDFGLSWDGSQNGHFSIYFNRVDAGYNLALASPRVFSDPRFDSTVPNMGWSGHFYFLVWRDESTGRPQVVLAALDTRSRLSASPLQVSKSDRDVHNPIAVWNGEEFGIMWQQTAADGNREIWFRRVGCAE